MGPVAIPAPGCRWPWPNGSGMPVTPPPTSGNPHLVVLVADLDGVDLVGTGSWVEQQFADRGQRGVHRPGSAPDTLDLLVWERGAGVTEACGTGATAAAHLAHPGAWSVARCGSPCPGGRRGRARPRGRPRCRARAHRAVPARRHDRGRPMSEDRCIRRPGADAADGPDPAAPRADEPPRRLRRLRRRDQRAHRPHLPGEDRPGRGHPSRRARGGHRASPRRAGPAGRHRRRRRGRPRRAAAPLARPGHLPRLRQGRRAAASCARRSMPTPWCSTTSSAPPSSATWRRSLGRTAIDRTAVILDIFAQNAHSQEGKAQVELAQIRYRLPRLRGRGTALSQQRGGIGARQGGGETQLEVDRRKLLRRMHKLEADLREITRVRHTQAKARQRSQLSPRGHRRLHQRRQVDAAQPPHRRGGPGRGPALRHARRHHPPPAAPRRRDGPGDRHRRVHHQAAPPSWWRRSSPPWRWWSTPTCWSTWWTRRPPTPRSTSGPSSGCSDEIGAGDVPQLLVVNKVDARPRTGPSACSIDHPGSVAVSAGDRRGDRATCCAASATGCGASRPSPSWSCPSTGATCWPRCTARARCWSRRPPTTGMRVRARLDDAAVSRLREFVVAGSTGSPAST